MRRRELVYRPFQPLRAFVQDIESGPPRAITTDVTLGAWPALVTPDGRRLLVRTAGLNGQWRFQPLEGSPGESAPLESLDRPLAFSPAGDALFVQKQWKPGPLLIDRIDLATGARGRWQEVAMADPAGVTRGMSVVLTPDGRSIAYTVNRVLSELYLVRGLR